MGFHSEDELKRLPWLLVAVFYVPLICMALLSLGTGLGARFVNLRTINFAEMSLGNYAALSRAGPVARWYANTMIYAAVVAIGSGILALAGGFAMVKMKARLRRLTLVILVIAMAIPSTVIIIPLFLEMRYMGISGLPAVMLKSLAVPSGIIIAWQFLKSMPDGYFEAAVLDGATDLQTLWHIVLPISKPVFALTAIGKGMEFMGDYLWQSINLISPKMQTVVVAFTNQIWTVASSVGGTESMINIKMAMGVGMFIPTLLIFLAGRKHLMDYTVDGGVKG
jgi:ABC-type glycerol-3-phosphate transport system permease component